MTNTVDSIYRAQICYEQNKSGRYIVLMAQAVSHETGYTAKQAKTLIEDAIIGVIADMYDGKAAVRSDD